MKTLIFVPTRNCISGIARVPTEAEETRMREQDSRPYDPRATEWCSGEGHVILEHTGYCWCGWMKRGVPVKV